MSELSWIFYDGSMNELHAHYRLLLGLDDQWQVQNVDLQMEANSVVIQLRHSGGKLCCPECQDECSRADTAPTRQWRHLDTMQFETIIEAAIPRSKCDRCGVKTIAVPWAAKHSRFTLMFEAFAIKVLHAASSVSAATKLLKLSWKTAHELMQRGVERGLQRRDTDPIETLGIDEKSFGKGQDYVSLMVDLEGSRVLEVVKDRSETSCDKLFDSLTDEQKSGIRAVAVDFWQAFRNSIVKQVPQAKIVHDHFHISQYLGEAVDLVRRRENKLLRSEGINDLTGTRQLWLYNEETLDDATQKQIEDIRQVAIKTARAWGIKEMFRDFWTYRSGAWAKKFFDRWYAWAIRSKLDPIKKVARMLKKHLAGLLAYFEYSITNAKSEAFNGRVQAIKSAARGFRNFENYRTRILFYCGALKMEPDFSH
ncbi:ISL3 family transposase [Roseimaritima ulvae]|uniref:Transposase n=1 Tax=Roseimaritima ulvae TaxID=980254 RepID=A0A5B9R4S5_9BACT|nr:ISL3 family transposase [Roseimaritima ulvae]QEG41371.1 Transposase [Roseimaritima ulvae]QEG41481.1 Transposase [Roseimaritima ulvae]